MPSSPSPELPLSPKAQQLAKEWAQNPQSKVFVPLAEEYAKLGMLQRAAMLLEEGISAYPGYVVAMVALGAVYFEMKEFESAKDVLEAAILSSPENLKAHRVLAQIYVADGNTEAAKKSCTVVLMTNPMDEEIRALQNSLGLAPSRSGSPSATASARQGSRLPEPRTSKEERSKPGIEESALTEAPLQTASPSVSQAATATTDTPSSARHAQTIARLEKWLGRIQSARQTA